MKSLILGMMTPLFIMVIGCSDIPTEPSITYQSGEVRSSGKDDKSKDLSVVRMTGESSEFDATGKRSPNIKGGMSFEVSNLWATPQLKVRFTVPLESDLNTKRHYYLEIYFLKPQIQAMKLLKFFLKSTLSSEYNSKADQSSIKTYCSLTGEELSKGAPAGQTDHVFCEFGGKNISNSQTRQHRHEFSDEEKAQIRGFQFKSVLLLLHEKSEPSTDLDSARQARHNVYYVDDEGNQITSGDTSGYREVTPKQYGYRCLLNKRISDPEEGMVKYHACRYPKRGRSS